MNKNQRKSLIILIILIIIVLIVVSITKLSTNENSSTTQNKFKNNNNNKNHSNNGSNKDIVDKKYNDKIILSSIGTDYFFYNFLLENNKETIENETDHNKYKNIYDETNNNIREIQEIKTTNNQPITIKKAKLTYQDDNKQIKEIKILDKNSKLQRAYMFFYDQEGEIETISVVDSNKKEIEKYEITNNTNGLVEEIKKTPQARGNSQTTSKFYYNAERKLTKVSAFNFENQLINESVLNYSNNKLNQIEFRNNILNNRNNTTIFKILEQTN
ncbi:hypothetical protein ['Camptotheca acuminata' phytoplasma]|uniref:hypothetical protein n=1 Tax='Camptotheca acuminata' phytoplasma TaxID=3239192 RepID=UPI003519E8AC